MSLPVDIVVAGKGTQVQDTERERWWWLFFLSEKGNAKRALTGGVSKPRTQQSETLDIKLPVNDGGCLGAVGENSVAMVAALV